MADCKDSNINTPKYTEATPPASSKGCLGDSAGGNLGGGGVVLPPDFGGGGTSGITIVEAGDQIRVDDNSYPGVYSFKVHFEAIVPLTLTLSHIAYVGVDAQPAIVLFGKTVTSVELNWIYNKAIVTQSISNDYNLDNPILTIADRNTIYNPTAIIKKAVFTLTGNDGKGQPSSIATKSTTVDFANYLMWGDYKELLTKNVNEIPDLVIALKALNNTISNSKNRLIYSSGTSVNEHFYYVYPERLGFSFFTKEGSSQGGFVRLKSVNGILKAELAGGDVEQDIIVINEEGYSEKYLVYQSLLGLQGDSLKGFKITS